MNQQRVQIANNVYDNICKILLLLPDGCIISVENPTRSHMWSTSWFRKLIKRKKLFPISFQACMHGSMREKWTTFYTNHSGFSSLSLVCDSSHAHLPWGVDRRSEGWRFNTAEEAEYPAELCEKNSEISTRAAQECNMVVTAHQPSSNKTPSVKLRAVQGGRQPRGNLLPQLIPEFAKILQVHWPLEWPRQAPRMLSTSERAHFSLPFATKLLSFKKGESATDELCYFAELGVYRTPDQFTEEALKLHHPFDDCSSVPDDIKRAIFWLLTSGPLEVSQQRKQILDKYAEMRNDLEEAEQTIHHQLDPEREAIIRDKKILLFKQMCRDAGVEDDGLCDLLANGVKLTGSGGSTAQFEPDVREPSISNVQLIKSATWTRKKILGKSSGEASDKVIKSVWDGACEEAGRGWLSGPYTETELINKLGPMFVVSRRFGLEQSDKVRAIDDMTESLVNSAYGSQYKLDLPGIDGVSTTARTWLEGIGADRRIRFKLSDGKFLKGLLHHSLQVSDAMNLCGRTLDLDAAYKQLLTAKSSLWCSVLAVENMCRAKQLFISNVLPFGASASVYAFNRLARACHTIGVRLLGLVWGNYYDDFPQLDIVASNDDAQCTAERFFELIGWRVSMKESKRLPIAKRFDALGVTFDFTSSQEGVVQVKNKTSRVEQLCAELEEVEATRFLSAAKASSLRGKLQFAETHTFGRVLAAHLKEFGLRANGKLSGTNVSSELLCEIAWIKDFLRFSQPRKLLSGMSERRLYIFTDAALENYDMHGSLGMVAYFVEGNVSSKRFFFSDSVPDDLMRTWQADTCKIISTLELFAAVYAVQILSVLFQHVRVMLFVDNEAARASLISLKTGVERHRCLLRNLSRLIQHRGMYTWIARVPSHSNCSDEPSRLVTEHLLQRGFERLPIDWHEARTLASENKCRCSASLTLIVSVVHVQEGVSQCTWYVDVFLGFKVI